MSSFSHFDDLDEVAAFGDYLVKVEAIPEGGFLHLRTKPLKMRRTDLRAYMSKTKPKPGGWLGLADKFPDQYRSFKTLRRLTR